MRGTKRIALGVLLGLALAAAADGPPAAIAPPRPAPAAAAPNNPFPPAPGLAPDPRYPADDAGPPPSGRSSSRAGSASG